MKLILILSIFALFVLNISACGLVNPKRVKYATDDEDLISKILEPKSDQGLVYVIRPNTNWVHAIPFKIGKKTMGHLNPDQYLYFYTFPFEFIYRSKNESIHRVTFEPGKTYFLSIVKPTFSRRHYIELINKDVGNKYIKNNRLTKEFVSFYDNSNSYKAKNNSISQLEYEKLLGNIELKYQEETKSGFIIYKTRKINRENSLKFISKFCKTKNIALKTSDYAIIDDTGAYKTLSESYINNKHHIEFICLY